MAERVLALFSYADRPVVMAAAVGLSNHGVACWQRVVGEPTHAEPMVKPAVKEESDKPQGKPKASQPTRIPVEELPAAQLLLFTGQCNEDPRLQRELQVLREAGRRVLAVRLQRVTPTDEIAAAVGENWVTAPDIKSMGSLAKRVQQCLKGVPGVGISLDGLMQQSVAIDDGTYVELVYDQRKPTRHWRWALPAAVLLPLSVGWLLWGVWREPASEPDEQVAAKLTEVAPSEPEPNQEDPAWLNALLAGDDDEEEASTQPSDGPVDTGESQAVTGASKADRGHVNSGDMRGRVRTEIEQVYAAAGAEDAEVPEATGGPVIHDRGGTAGEPLEIDPSQTGEGAGTPQLAADDAEARDRALQALAKKIKEASQKRSVESGAAAQMAKQQMEKKLDEARQREGERQAMKLQEFNKAVEADPENPAPYRERAGALRSMGKYREAMADHDKSIELEPNDDENFKERAKTLQAMNRPGEALDDLERAENLDSQDPETPRLKGQAHRDLNQMQEAVAEFTKALQKDPQYAEAAYDRGKTRRMTEEPEKAEADFQHAINLQTDFAPAHAGLGELEVDEGDPDAAIEHFDTAVEHDPRRRDTFVLRADAHASLRRFDLALADYETAIRLKWDDDEAFAKRAEVYRQMSDWGRSVANADVALAINPKNVLAHTMLALALKHVSDYAAARQHADWAVDFGPENPLGFAARGWVALGSGDWDAASSAFEASLGLDGACVLALLGQGTWLSERSEHEAAKRVLAQGIELAPRSPRPQWRLARARMRAGDLEAATQHAKRALELDPESPLPHVVLAQARLSMGDIPGLRKHVEMALQRDQRHAVAYGLRAIADLHEDQVHRAATWTQEMARLAPNHWFTHFVAGVVALRRNEALEAQALAEAALAANDKRALPYLLRARIHLFSDQHEQAVSDADTAVALAPQDPLCFQARAVIHRHAGSRRLAARDLDRALDLSHSGLRDPWQMYPSR